MMFNHTYSGRRIDGKPVVTVDGQPLSLGNHLVQHSEDLDWGYNGDDCAQLAYAILCHEFDAVFAIHDHQDFKRSVISRLPDHHWTLDSKQIRALLRKGTTTDEPS